MLAIIAGTRPELLKLASVFEILERENEKYLFIWTGQHYDYEMSRVFIEELSLPEPDITLNISHRGKELERTTEMVIHLYEVLVKKNVTLTASLGDTDSVLASALASAKAGIPYIHIESGYRSWDLTMPEEINRIIADHIAAFLIAPTELSYLNLVHEGISREYISLSGSPLIDVVKKISGSIELIGDRILDEFNLQRENYILVTIHRQENVDDTVNLRMILKALLELASNMKIVVPPHPRTRKRLYETGLYNTLANNANVIVTKPLNYTRFIGLLKNSYAVITDSGGVLEEAATYNVPVIIPRNTIEKPEIIDLGLGVLTGPYTHNIVKAFKSLVRVRERIVKEAKNKTNPFGNGNSGYKIYKEIHRIIEMKQHRMRKPDYRDNPLVKYVLIKRAQTYNNIYSGCTREDLYYYNHNGLPVTNKEEAEIIGSRLRCKVDTVWLREYLS